MATIVGTSGNDLLVGGSEIDTVQYLNSTASVTVNLELGTSAGFGADTLTNIENVVGSNFNDVLIGDTRNNALSGSAGNDVLLGGIGNDTLNGGAGDDTLNGGADIDTAEFTDATGSVTVNLELGTSTGAGADTLTNIEKVIGSVFGDVLAGDAQSNTLSGGDGNDFLIGGDGSDILSGNAGNDTLSGGNGKDVLNGGTGDDLLDGGSDVDTAHFTDATGTVTVNLELGTSTGFGTDTLVNIENVVGSSFGDVLAGDLNNNTLFGGAGNDIALGGDGSDTINGEAGNDVLFGGSNDDVLNGGLGDDTIDGGSGIDTAVFNGSLAGYTLTKTGGTYVARANAGTDGTDTLNAVESLRFADKTVNLTIQAKAAATPAADVTRLAELYVAFFNRVPDADGLSYWIDQKNAGQSISQIADVFYSAGVQYSDLTGFSAGMTNEDFVNKVYRNVLGRTEGADAEGLAYWSGQLTKGEATRGSLVSTILDSAHSFKGNATYGFVADLLDNKYVVAKTFAIDLGLNYNTPAESISQGMAIAAAVKSTGTDDAIALIGVSASFITLA